MVKADPGEMEQVIMNLAVNARDAMPNGGTLTIETQDVEIDAARAAGRPSVAPGPYVMLAATDTGVGMDESTRARIFEPFFTTKGPARGTGLGLSTVFGIVKQSGGDVWVHSELGRGTTFKVYLPRVSEAAQARRATRTAAKRGGTETILVVEDEATVGQLAARGLRAAGYTVISADNAHDAITLLARHDGHVDLMLTDLVMPGMSGRALAEHLASRRPTTKVLYTSGYTDDPLLRLGVLEESAQFIAKPYTLTELTRKVREVLDAFDRSGTTQQRVQPGQLSRQPAENPDAKGQVEPERPPVAEPEL
jgi:CheY-like chemotaxis protein